VQSPSKTDSGSNHSLLAPGDLLQDRYRIVRQLAKGGMGAVYEAVDQRLEATVALKETFSVHSRLRRQFEQEARLLAQLNHPALPRVSDYFTEGDRAFLVMQFIAGADLAEIIAKQPGPFPRNQVVAWADQMLDALIYLHTRDRQIIHRDIKPHNLKLTAAGKIALLDFGLAKSQSPEAGETSNSIFGYTRRYAPLEQIQDEGTTPQSDIYALGATLYHLLTGIKPADAVLRAAATEASRPDPLRPADEIHPAVGRELASILSRAMAQNPADRYPSATAFREALWHLGRIEGSGNGAAGPGTGIKKTGPLTPPANTTGRVRTSDPFESYSILKPEEPAWFSPRQSRNPNAIVAGVLLALLIGLVGSLYGYRQLTASSSRAARTPKANLSSDDSGKQANRAAKMRPHAIGGPARGSEGPDGRGKSERIITGPRSTESNRPVFKIDTGSLQVGTPLMVPLPRGQTGSAVNTPETRLPTPDPIAIEPGPLHRLPAFAQPGNVAERLRPRTPAGGQILDFSDGATRVFRPGGKGTTPE